jgi:hypothetical protein
MKRAGWAAGVLLAFLLVNLAGWPWLPQQFNLSLLPLILALAVRALDNFLPVCCPEFYRRKWDHRRAIANNATNAT